jgi:hypothetical protein
VGLGGSRSLRAHVWPNELLHTHTPLEVSSACWARARVQMPGATVLVIAERVCVLACTCDAGAARRDADIPQDRDVRGYAHTLAVNLRFSEPRGQEAL